MDGKNKCEGSDSLKANYELYFEKRNYLLATREIIHRSKALSRGDAVVAYAVQKGLIWILDRKISLRAGISTDEFVGFVDFLRDEIETVHESATAALFELLELMFCHFGLLSNILELVLDNF